MFQFQFLMRQVWFDQSACHCPAFSQALMVALKLMMLGSNLDSLKCHDNWDFF
jgi:hypothetical protein